MFKKIISVFFVIVSSAFALLISSSVNAQNINNGSQHAIAVTITSDLQQILGVSKQSELVNIIIDFSDQANYNRTHHLGKHNRSNLISASRVNAQTSQQKLIEFLHSNNITDYKELSMVNALALSVEAQMMPSITALVGVSRIRYDKETTINTTTTNEPGTPEWNIEQVKTPLVWDRGFTGQGIVIGILGTGVDVNHPDLAPRYRGGTNSWFDKTRVNSLIPYDTNGHGTAVMGVALGGSQSGVNIGMAPGASWIAAKIFCGAGKTKASEIMEEFQWMIDPDGDSTTDDVAVWSITPGTLKIQ